MTAGRRDTLVLIQRATTTQDPYGDEVETWGQIGREWAAVYFGRGDERRQAAMEQGSQAANFQMLSTPVTRALVITDRLIANNRVWDIEGIASDTPKRGQVEITAVASSKPISPADIVGEVPMTGDGWAITGSGLSVNIDELPGA